ncbi:MAG: DUF4255 domain-containing protein, partial [Ginsengibacter sp.]
MIRTALKFLQNELDSYIVSRENDAAYSIGNVVALQSIAFPDGKINLDDTMHITMMLVSLEEELLLNKRPYFTVLNDQEKIRLNPPVEINLSILFVANNTHYETALRDLSHVISFFQSHVVFQGNTYPGLNDEVTDPAKKPWQTIEKLVLNIRNLTLEQQNNLWGMLGPKYLPSIVYSVRMLTVFDPNALS